MRDGAAAAPRRIGPLVGVGWTPRHLRSSACNPLRSANSISQQAALMLTRNQGAAQLSRQRLEEAKKLLLNPYFEIEEIAAEVGFQSLPCFNRAFSQMVGESPERYRSHLFPPLPHTAFQSCHPKTDITNNRAEAAASAFDGLTAAAKTGKAHHATDQFTKC
jgi:AraC-like DNA-binding protein